MDSSRSASAPRPLPEGTSATALIAAAGSGKRLGAGGHKALIPAAGRPLLAWSVAAFAAAPSVTAAVIAAPRGAEDEVARVAAEAAGDLTVTVVAGGASRAASVAAGLAEVKAPTVAVHDAARPLVTAELIEALLGALAANPEAAGVIAATPVADTLKRVDVGVQGPMPAVGSTESRDGLWAAQTPQVFRTEALRRAHAVDADALAAATDDAALVERSGGRVLLAATPGANFKVTTQADLSLAAALLAR